MTGPELRRIDSRSVPGARGEIRASLIVRNESRRLPALLAHHRRIGVDRFFVVDNDSDDGTRELLEAEPDVHLFWTDAPFRTRKCHWRRALVDEFFRGWGLHLDGDELLVYPGMEELDLRRFCAFLDEQGAAGLFTVLVDMYPREPLDEVSYRPGEPLIERFPYFDRSGYSLRYRGRRLRSRAAPAFLISGGPRERVFFAQQASPLSRLLARRLYDIRRRRPPVLTSLPLLGPALNGVARRALPPYMPNCGKVPLLRWEPELGIETACLEALHEIRPPLPLSDCWGCLLHFKYMPGLRQHVEEAAAGRLYGSADAEYERYDEVLRQRAELRLHGPLSVRFESTRDLVDAGLMRRSPGLEQFLARGRREARDLVPPAPAAPRR